MCTCSEIDFLRGLVRIEFKLFVEDGTVLEGTADLHPATVHSKNASDRAAWPVPNQARTTLPDHIVDMRQAGYFRDSRTAEEVHRELQSTYPCDLNRVEVALIRLQRRKELRKTSKFADGRERIAYVW